MRVQTRYMIFLALCLGLAGCNTPRGAGFQSEVLAVAKQDKGAKAPAESPTEKTREFEVVAVTGPALAGLKTWPAVGARHYDWLARRPQRPSMIIATGDSLSIKVWDTETNSLLARDGERVSEISDLTVGLTGSIDLPFIGAQEVSGMAPDAARAKIEAAYSALIPSAQVQLQMRPGRANTASLVSGVAKPGTYPLPDRDYTVLNLLSEGGGVVHSFVNPQIRLMRGNAVYGISVDRLFETPALDTTLRGGDRVIVQEDSRYFLSLGAAGSEAQHIFPTGKVTALDALSIMGGIQDSRANPQGILILRQYPRKALRQDGKGPRLERVVFTLDLTSADGLFSAGQFAVMPGDLVYATENRLTATTSILGLLGAALGIAKNASDL